MEPRTRAEGPRRRDKRIRIRLTTKDSRYALPESAPILVPSSFRRLALSSLVNGLLEHDRPVPFDFIIRGSYLRSSLEDLLSAQGISSETVVEAEYSPAQKVPQYVCSYEHDDWVSAVDTVGNLVAERQQQGRILSASYDGRIRVWNSSSQVLATSTAPAQGGHWSFIKDAKFVSSAQIVSAGFDRVVRVWKYQEAEDGLAANLTPELELHGHSACIDAVDVHQASHRILTASADHSIGLWSTRRSDAPALSPELAASVARESGKRRKLNGAGAVTQRGPLSMLRQHRQHVSGVIFDRKDSTVAYSTSWDQTLRTWDLVTSTVVDTRLTKHALLVVEQVPELQLIATGTAGREISLIDPRASASAVTAMRLKGHRNAVVGLARDPGNHHRLASASHDGTCRVWDVRFTKQGQDGITSQSLYTLGRHSLQGKPMPEAGVGVQVYGICWDSELGILSCGQDKCIQVNNFRTFLFSIPSPDVLTRALDLALATAAPVAPITTAVLAALVVLPDHTGLTPTPRGKTSFMPIKLPKGFQRRKSSGNALEEISNASAAAPGSSFRVIERPALNKSHDGNLAIRTAASAGLESLDNGPDDLFSHTRPDAGDRYDSHTPSRQAAAADENRNSARTETSNTPSQHPSGASSSRRSTSTNPSSIDSHSDRYGQQQQQVKAVPAPPPPSARPGFLRNSTHTFSLTKSLRSTKVADAAPVRALPPTTDNTRSRALTASSASTATPPKLFDSEVGLDNVGLDGFGNMFDGIGTHMNRDQRSPSENDPSTPSHRPNYPPSAFPGAAITQAAQRPSAPTRPLTAVASNGMLDSSPYSPPSDSHDSLTRSPSPSRTITQNSPSAQSGPTLSLRSVSNSASLSRSLAPPEDDAPPPVPKHANYPSGQHGSKPTAASQDDYLDPGLAASAELWSRFDTAKPSPPRGKGQNKVMTHAQFERYKKQQEIDGRVGALSDPEEDDGDVYDDEDEDQIEKEKRASKQRKKQEAHLAVYRQQMMKVTGEQSELQPRSTSSTLNLPRANSTPELGNRLSNMTTSTKESSGGEEDEDEDVPLGILAAHGFPNKNRPPTQLTHSSSNPNLRNLGQVDVSKRGSLPVFARNLPQDPYFGASIVNTPNREPLSMHVTQVPPLALSGAATAHPHHPAGLVGVIAGEEKARALRRGGPNVASVYDLPQSMQNPVLGRPATLPPMMPQMGLPGMPPMQPMHPMFPQSDPAQLQMNQHMSQMMQLQLHWMQQMTNMMGSQMNQVQGGGPPMSPGLGPQGGQMGRPQQPLAPMGQRTMSTLTPSMANWNLNPTPGYAPSIAPSERSNVGLAPRYRPVSTVQDSDPATRRASTFTSSTLRPWSALDSTIRPLSHNNKPPAANAVGRKSPLAQIDDDDDEQAWAEMKAKKETKQKTWKLRKGNNVLQELYNGVS
ncbi:hypothetical protein DV738_g2685, partial [Chaetothyriales sp. CBS 135597]